MHIRRILASTAFALGAVACGGGAQGGDSKPTEPGTSNVAITGTLGGRPFAAKTVLAYVNAVDAGASVHQTIRVYDSPVTCDTMYVPSGPTDKPPPERYLMLSFVGGDGTTVDLSPDPQLPESSNASGQLSEFDDETVTPAVREHSTGGSLTIVKAATVPAYDAPDAGPGSRGHIAITMRAGSDEIAGEADYFLCY